MEYIKFQFKLTNPLPKRVDGGPAMSTWGFETVYEGPTRNVNGSFLSKGDITADLALHGTRHGVCLAPATKFNREKIAKMESTGQIKVLDRVNIKHESEPEEDTEATIIEEAAAIAETGDVPKTRRGRKKVEE